MYMKKNMSPTKIKYLTVGFACVVLITVALIWMITAVYVQRDDRTVVRRLAWYFPIASVGAQTINYGQFMQARDAIRVFLNSQVVKDAGRSQPLTPQIEQSAYDRLLREAVTRELAKQHNVTVSDEDVRAAYTAFLVQASSSVSNVAQYLADTFHWTEEQYRFMVIRPQLLEEKVVATFPTSTDQYTQFEGYVASRLAKPDVKKYLKF